MSTAIVSEAAQTPPPPPVPVHPPIPLGLGSYVSLTGISGAIAAFVIAWGENSWHMTGPIAVLAVAAAGAIIGFFQARSQQAAKLIEGVRKDLGALGIGITPPPPGPPA